MLFKKAQATSASGAAIMILILTALIIGYILFLPPAERAEILGDGNGQGGSGAGGGAVLLLAENPGTIAFTRTDRIEHPLPAFSLITESNAQELKKVNSIYLKSTAFTKDSKTITFSVNQFITDELLLSFNIDKAKGRLIIFLNGQEVFNNQLGAGSGPPVDLPGDLLNSDGDNNITFFVSSPGIAFWSANEYQLSNVLISGKTTDYSRSLSQQNFAIGAQEHESIERGTLEYNPQCDLNSVGTLDITVNGLPVFSGIPNCNVPNQVELSKDRLINGDNVVSFYSAQGRFTFDNVKIVTKLMKPIDPIYYYNLHPTLFEDVRTRNKDVFLILNFPEEFTEKIGYLTVNGHSITFRHEGYHYETEISQFVKPGTNSIIIKPAGTTLEVAELLVEAR